MVSENIVKYLKTYKRSPRNINNIKLLAAEYKQNNDTDNAIRFLKILTIRTRDIAERGIALNEIGVLYYQRQEFVKAIKYFKQVIQITEIRDVFNNISKCYSVMCQYDSAKRYAFQSLKLNDHFAAHNIIAEILFIEKAYDESIEHYQQSLQLSNAQESITAQYNIAFPYLAKKEFITGFRYYENRLVQSPKGEVLSDRLELPALKLWRAEDDFTRLLVVAEQGLGDIVMFFRFVLQLAETYPDKQIHFFCKQSLAHLFTYDQKNVYIITSISGVNTHLYDYKVYCMSLPHHLKIKNIDPYPVKYISVNAGVNERWRNRLNASKRFKVGVVWKGLLSSWIEKEIPVNSLRHLVNLDMDLICLHRKSDVDARINNGELADRLLTYDIDQEQPFEDTVAIMNNLDLLITVDTVTVHLAGNMHTKTWLVLGEYSDWRWFKESDQVWYDNVELIRNDKRDDWDNALANIARRIQAEFGILPYK